MFNWDFGRKRERWFRRRGGRIREREQEVGVRRTCGSRGLAWGDPEEGRRRDGLGEEDSVREGGKERERAESWEKENGEREEVWGILKRKREKGYLSNDGKRIL